MYFLFRFHHILPGDYYKRGKCEKEIIKAFLHRQIDDMREESGVADVR